MPFYVYVVIVVVAIIFAWVFIYENFIKDDSPTSKIYPSRKPENTAYLKKVLNHGAVGEPLIMYNKTISNKKLKADSYRLNLPVYTVPCEDRGLVVGVSGSGKTNFILAQILDWMKSGKSFVCSDVKPEIWGILASNGVLDHFGYASFVINPTDPKSHKYNLFDDLKSDNDLDELLQVLLPVKSEEGAVFADLGRLILKACIIFVRDRDGGQVSLTSVYDYIVSQSSGKKLLEKLSDNGGDKVKELVSLAMKTADNERLLSAGLNAVVETFQFMSNDNIRINLASSDYSLNECLKSPKIAVFLQFEQDSINTTERLFSVHVQHIIRLLMSNANQRDDVFLIFDELLNGGKIENLADKFNLIRSYKMPMFLYIQSVAGLVEKYGKAEADKIISACSLQICYRVNDSHTAEFFSKLVGQVSAERVNKSVSPIVTADGRMINKANISKNLEMVDLVPPEMMLQLGFGKALCVYKGQSAIIDIPQHFKDTPLKNGADFVRLGDLTDNNNEIIEEIME